MMSNEKKNTADFHPWDSIEGLGWSVSQQHKRAAGKMGAYSGRNRLGCDRVSLAADIYRRYNRNSLSVVSGSDFPLVNFFPQTFLQSHDRGGESLSQYTPLGMEPLHRMVDISPHRPHIGIRRGLMDDNLCRSTISLAANENSSMSIYPSKLSGQGSMAASNATGMPHSSYIPAHISEQAIIRRRAGGIAEKPSLDNSLIVMDSNTNGGHFPGLVQRAVDRQRRKGFILNPAYKSSVARFARLEHYYPDNKTVSKTGSDSIAPAINQTTQSSPGIIARQQQISSEVAQPENNRAQSSVQRAINRQNRVLSQNHDQPGDNNVFKGEPARFTGNELLTGHTAHFAAPLATVNRKFSLSSGNRFEGLGLGRKIAGRTAGTLSQQGYAADFIPESAIAGIAPMAVAVSGIPVISHKAELSSEIITRQQRVSSEVAQPGNNRSQSSVQRALSRQNSVLSQNHDQPGDNNVFKGEPARFTGNELLTGHTAHFAAPAPLATINRKFSLSSGNRFEGLGLGQKIAGRTVGTLSQQEYAADFIPESAIAGLAPLTDTVSGVPAISPKAEIIARQQQLSSEVAQPGNNRSQSSVQRALSRQNSALSQNHYQHRDNKINKNEPARFVGNELWTAHTAYFASPLATVNRKFSPSSDNRFEGLGLGRKIAGRTVGTLSQQGEVADFFPASAVAGFAPLEHYYADSKTTPMADTVSGVPAISPKAESASEIIARQEQLSSEAAQPGNNRSQGSVQRAVDRQNSSLSQITPGSRIRHKVADLPITAVRNRESVYSPGSTAFSNTNGVSVNPIHSTLHLPLSQPYVVQRKTALSGDHAAAGDGSGYLQLQEVKNTSAPPPHTTLAQTGQAADSVTGKSDSNALSTDDVVDKVWRKLMRKLVSEQERMGGSNRWA